MDIDAFLHCNDLTYLSKGEEELAKYKKGDKLKVEKLDKEAGKSIKINDVVDAHESILKSLVN